eukprot:TRINITY_DN28303_c0_g1_i1.p1 TRINITY_DN28303_c0_g1~~TRINITY_DN28303_c0_g1_i1.p1  ORF type:complete len:324 (+),score=47.08 TRINITY_DN28303_c0_g1_i1:3-974(+)
MISQRTALLALAGVASAAYVFSKWPKNQIDNDNDNKNTFTDDINIPPRDRSIKDLGQAKLSLQSPRDDDKIAALRFLMQVSAFRESFELIRKLEIIPLLISSLSTSDSLEVCRGACNVLTNCAADNEMVHTMITQHYILDVIQLQLQQQEGNEGLIDYIFGLLSNITYFRVGVDAVVSHAPIMSVIIDNLKKSNHLPSCLSILVNLSCEPSIHPGLVSHDDVIETVSAIATSKTEVIVIKDKCVSILSNIARNMDIQDATCILTLSALLLEEDGGDSPSKKEVKKRIANTFQAIMQSPVSRTRMEEALGTTTVNALLDKILHL